MKILLTTFLFILLSTVNAQEVTFLDKDWNEIADSSNFFRKKITTPLEQDSMYSVEYYRQGNSLLSRTAYHGEELDTRHGLSTVYFENGNVKMKVNYTKGKEDGAVKTFWEDGTAKRSDIYEDGEFVEGKCFDENGNEIEHFDYMMMPSFPGGKEKLIRFIYRGLKYPREARKLGIQGLVAVQFVVEKDGSIALEEVVKSVHETLDKEALRIIDKMPNWIPGKQDGEPLRVRYTLPVSFKLTE